MASDDAVRCGDVRATSIVCSNVTPVDVTIDSVTPDSRGQGASDQDVVIPHLEPLAVKSHDEVQTVAALGAADIAVDEAGRAVKGKRLGELGTERNSNELSLGQRHERHPGDPIREVATLCHRTSDVKSKPRLAHSTRAGQCQQALPRAGEQL